MPDISVMQGYIEKSDLGNPERDKELLSQLNKMSPEEKFKWWQNELSRCIKCYACRQACPMCYCSECFVDSSNPKWIEKGLHSPDLQFYHVTRAYHQAGRCTACGPMGSGPNTGSRVLIRPTHEKQVARSRDCPGLAASRRGVGLSG